MRRETIVKNTRRTGQSPTSEPTDNGRNVLGNRVIVSLLALAGSTRFGGFRVEPPVAGRLPHRPARAQLRHAVLQIRTSRFIDGLHDPGRWQGQLLAQQLAEVREPFVQHFVQEDVAQQRRYDSVPRLRDVPSSLMLTSPASITPVPRLRDHLPISRLITPSFTLWLMMARSFA